MTNTRSTLANKSGNNTSNRVYFTSSFRLPRTCALHRIVASRASHCTWSSYIVSIADENKEPLIDCALAPTPVTLLLMSRSNCIADYRSQ